MGELELHNAAPNGLYNLLVEGVPPGKQQVLTMPKSSNASYWYTSEGTTTVRAAIALAYALGGNMFTPWDIYLPVPAAEYTEKTGRYYGQPEQYVDLFAFVRGGAKALLEEGARVRRYHQDRDHHFLLLDFHQLHWPHSHQGRHHRHYHRHLLVAGDRLQQ